IAVISPYKHPYETFKQRCENSHIDKDTRLRSDAGATPDNIWGVPSYAVRESWSNLKRLKLGGFFSPLFKVFTESYISEPFTPKSGQVFESITHEAKRIGWNSMLFEGMAQTIHPLENGGYEIQVLQNKRKFKIQCEYLHLGIGYSKLNKTDEQLSFEKHHPNLDIYKNVYEDHSHILNHLKHNGGTIIIRGRGIAASMLLQKLYELCMQRDDIRILHLLRHHTHPSMINNKERSLEHEWEYQHYNFPKSCFGGEYKINLEGMPGHESYIPILGGTTSADRTSWKHIVEEGLDKGFYSYVVGSVQSFSYKNQRVSIEITQDNDISCMVSADFMIDATGLSRNLRTNELFEELINTNHVSLTRFDTLQTNSSFCVLNPNGKDINLFASGVVALGNTFAPVDSFSGMTYAGLKITEFLCTKLERPHNLSGLGSLLEWSNWILHKPPQ
ncbi:hypothetical protein KC717_03335, partial [Candidatus Dojkabacteria bacterium]|nr:hypothetical protein [Candidatus Dojkabacteria bacterium]